MSSIGTFTFMQMTGEKLQALSPVIEMIVRPGTNGEIYREEPGKSRVFEVQTVEGYTALTGASGANAAAAGYTALKGTLVTVVDDNWLTAYNVRVVDVQNVAVQAVLMSNVAGVNYVVSARWWLKPTV
jgi:hypothetical protein